MAAPMPVGLRRVSRCFVDIIYFMFLANILTYAVSHFSDGIEGYLLCRRCGMEIAKAADLMAIPSALAHRQRNDTISGKKEVLIQLFRNPHGNMFEVITTASAKLHTYDKAYAEHSWFPGYTWTISVCPNCGVHIGWAFDILPSHVDGQRVSSFVGMILDNIIHESGFPSVVGCIDGTFVRIQRPSANEADFVNRKGYHALNVQMCCDARFRITSCNASWPGSVHDSRIFRTSALCRAFENGSYKGLLLGDSGYPCRWFLMTPLLNPTTPAEERFNNSLCRTRVLIEQTFGILKRRFQCLHNELKTSPQQAVTYVLACVVLHNFGIDHGDILLHDDDVNVHNNINDYIPQGVRQDGAEVRRHLIGIFFRN